MAVSKTRAIAIFGKNDEGGVDWPYGVWPQVPNPTWSPEEHRTHLKDRAEAQQLVFDWAQKYGLKKTDKGCCPVWLQQDRNSRCSGRRECALYGANARACSWLDHTATWTFDKQPAVITSAPYELHQDYRSELNQWVQEDPRLAIAYGETGWYGNGTYQIILWRTDLIKVVEPA
ncbi:MULTISPECIES: hypothetical protein [unclassified Streptomyces]|uniref:hypothetical protein n=1 Tax=unclassified Streptomyces TaxID=2593676 RepID=UPI0037FA056F